LAILFGLALVACSAAAHDIPDEIHLHAFVKPEGGRLHLGKAGWEGKSPTSSLA